MCGWVGGGCVTKGRQQVNMYGHNYTRSRKGESNEGKEGTSRRKGDNKVQKTVQTCTTKCLHKHEQSAVKPALKITAG